MANFDPRVAGTPPLRLDVPTSDVDVPCQAPDRDAFEAVLRAAFPGEAGSSARRRAGVDGAVVASSTAHGRPIEGFGRAKPVPDQDGWRHFLVERRRLEFRAPALRAAVTRRWLDGLTTKPAFAAALGLAGGPYRVLFDVERRSDGALIGLLASVGSGA